MNATGLPAPAKTDGISLLPLLTKGEQPAERPIFWHYPHYGNQGGEPSSIIRVGDDYVAGVAKATRAWEDKYAKDNFLFVGFVQELWSWKGGVIGSSELFVDPYYIDVQRFQCTTAPTNLWLVRESARKGQEKAP